MQTLRVIAALVALCASLSGTSRLALAQVHPDSVVVERVTPRWSVGPINVQLGASGETSLPQRASAGGWLSTFSFGSAMLDAGVALVDRPSLLVYPQLSLGVRKTTLKVEQRGEFSYESGVQNPATSAGENAVRSTPREESGRYLRLSVGKPIGKRSDTLRTLWTALLSVISR